MQEEVDGLKNKIKKFSKGDFQLAQPQVVFPDTSLILTIGEGEVYKGYFMILFVCVVWNRDLKGIR